MRKEKAIIALLLILLVFLLVAEAFEYNYVFKLNFRFYEGICCSVNVELMRAITYTASIEFSIIYIILLLLRDYLCIGRIGRESVGFFIALVVSMVIVLLLKILFQVPRPPYGEIRRRSILYALFHFDNYSFSSGHAARATVIASYFTGRIGRVYSVLLWVWALLVMLSRLVLGVHWLTDVIASFLVGVLSVFLARHVEDIIYSKVYE